MSDSGNNYIKLIVQIDLPTNKLETFEMHLEDMLKSNTIDGYYFLTQNGSPVHHRAAHLEIENNLGRKIAAVQGDEIMIVDLADTDPASGIEYGDIS